MALIPCRTPPIRNGDSRYPSSIRAPESDGLIAPVILLTDSVIPAVVARSSVGNKPMVKDLRTGVIMPVKMSREIYSASAYADVGAMSIPIMAILTGIIALEKVIVKGSIWFARFVGFVFIFGGILVLAFPSVLTFL